MALLVAAPIFFSDICESKILPSEPEGAEPCCLTSIRNVNAGYKFCPGCGRQIPYKERIERVTQLGLKLGVTKQHDTKIPLVEILKPLEKDFTLAGPYRVQNGKVAAVLVGLSPVWAASPEGGISHVDPAIIASLKDDVEKRLESLVGRRITVSLWNIE